VQDQDRVNAVVKSIDNERKKLLQMATARKGIIVFIQNVAKTNAEAR
jgi:hypothetical protein